MTPRQSILAAPGGWLEREQRHVIDFLRKENRVLKAQLRGHRVRSTDDQRRRLAVLGHQIGRRTLRHIGTLVTPLFCAGIANWSPTSGRGDGASVGRASTGRSEHSSCGWRRRTRPGATRACRARCETSATASPEAPSPRLKQAGLPPVPERLQTWRSFLRAHWPAVVAADFFTTEGWTARGLVTYYTLFVIELASRRVHVPGSTPHPDERFMLQVIRTVTAADGVLGTRSVYL